MTVQIDPERFALAHAKFQKWMVEKSGGVPFTGFDHPFLIQDEIRYKWRVIDRATDALRLNRWNKWRRSPGTILEAVKSACAPAVSANLLEHRWPDRAPQAALTRVQPQNVGTLEEALCRFFEPGPFDRASFGWGFDNLAETLRRLRLGCQWPFLAYLAFLAHPHICFPMRSTRFERLLRFYGNDLRISGTVNWDRYQCLLDLANLLRERLSVYGRGTAIVGKMGDSAHLISLSPVKHEQAPLLAL